MAQNNSTITPTGKITHDEAFTKETLTKTFEKQCIDPELFSKPFFDFMIYSSRNTFAKYLELKKRDDVLAKEELRLMDENFKTMIQTAITDFKKSNNDSIFADLVLDKDKQKFITTYEKTSVQMLSNIKDAGKIDELLYNSLTVDWYGLEERPLFYNEAEDNEQQYSIENNQIHSVEFLYKDATPEQMFNLDQQATPNNKNFNKPFNINHFFDEPFCVNRGGHLTNLNGIIKELRVKPNLKTLEDWMNKNTLECYKIFKSQRPTNAIETAIFTILTDRVKMKVANEVANYMTQNKLDKEEFLNIEGDFRIPIKPTDSSIFKTSTESINANKLTPEQVSEYYLLFQKRNLNESKTEIENQEKDFSSQLSLLTQVESNDFDFNKLIEFLRSQGILERVLMAFAENPKDDLPTVIQKFEKKTDTQKQTLLFGIRSQVSVGEFEEKVRRVADKTFFEKALRNTNPEDIMFLNSPFPANVQLQIKSLFKQCEKFRNERAEFLKQSNAHAGDKDDIFTKPVVQLYFKLEKEWKELLTSGDAKRIKEKYNLMVVETEKFLDGKDYSKESHDETSGFRPTKINIFQAVKMALKKESEKVNWSAHKENIFTSIPVGQVRGFEDATAGKFNSFLEPSAFLEVFTNLKTLKAYNEARKPIASFLSEKTPFYGLYDDRKRLQLLVKYEANPLYDLMINKQFQTYQKNSWVLSLAPYDLKKSPKGTHLVHTEDWYDDFIEFLSNRENVDLYKTEITTNESGFMLDKMDRASALRVQKWFSDRRIPAPMILENVVEVLENGVETSQQMCSIGPIQAFNPNKVPQNKFNQTTVPYPFVKQSYTEKDLIAIVEFEKTQNPQISPVFDSNVEMKTFTLSKVKSLEELKTMFNYDEATGKFYPITEPKFDWMSITNSFHIAKEYSKSQNQKYPNEPSSAMTSNTIDFREPAEVDAYLNDMDVVLTLFNNNNGKSAEQKIHDQTEATTTSVFETISEGGTQSLFSFETNQNLQTSKHKVNQTPAFRVAKILKGEFFNSSMIEQPPEKPFAIPATLESFLKVDQPKSEETIRGNTLTPAEFQVKLMDKFRDLITYKLFQFCYPRLAAGIPYEQAFSSKDLQIYFKNFKESMDLQTSEYDIDDQQIFHKKDGLLNIAKSTETHSTGNSGWLKSLLSDTLIKNMLNLHSLKEEISLAEKNPNTNPDTEAMKQSIELMESLEAAVVNGTKILSTSKKYFSHLQNESQTSVTYQKLKTQLLKDNPKFAKEKDLEFLRVLKEYITKVLPNEIPTLNKQAQKIVNEKYGNSSLNKFTNALTKNMKQCFPETEILTSTREVKNHIAGETEIETLNDVLVPTLTKTMFPKTARWIKELKNAVFDPDKREEKIINGGLKFLASQAEIKNQPFLINAYAEHRSSTAPIHDNLNAFEMANDIYVKQSNDGLYAKKGFTTHSNDSKTNLKNLSDTKNKDSIFFTKTIDEFNEAQLRNLDSLNYKIPEDSFLVTKENEAQVKADMERRQQAYEKEHPFAPKKSSFSL